MQINNSKNDAIRSGKWVKPNASFYDTLVNEDNYKDLINEAFLKHGNINKDTPYSSSKCKYPHHVIKDGELVLSEPGVRAAYARAKQMGVYFGSLKEHLDRHLEELDVFKEEKHINENFDFIMESINKTLGTKLNEDNDAEFSIGKKDLNGNKILDIDYIESDDGAINCRIKIDNTCMVNNKPQYMRGRSAMLCLNVRNDQVYIICKKHKDGYSMPGGGWNKGEDPRHAAIRELHEETLSKVRNVQQCGLLIECDGSKDKVQKWVKDHVANEDDWWYGYYSVVFIGIYNGKYEGTVEELDKEEGYEWVKYEDAKPDILNKEYIPLIDKYIEDYISIKSINEQMEWIDSFVNDEVFRENVLVEDSNTSPYDLLDKMKSFKYGWFTRGGVVHNGSEGIPGDFYHNFHLQSPEQLSASKVGVCWDYVELERLWFTQNNYKFAVFFIMLNDSNVQPTHTFLVYNIGKYNYWFEFSWEKYRGIHRYKSIDVMLKDVIMRHRQEYNDYDSDVSIHWLSDTPKYGITCSQYMKYAVSQPKLDYDNLPTQLFKEGVNMFDDDWAFKAFMEGDDADENDVDNTESDSEVNKEASNNEGSDEKDQTKQVSESLPKQTDRAEASKNGVRRKNLYIEFIKWCKEYNNKNTFGSIFDKDAFKVTYPFVPEEMRYFYRLANPMLCVLEGDLTFFPVAELRKVNSKNKKMVDMIIFAAAPDNNLRVFDRNDKKVYKAHEDHGQLVKDNILGNTFDTYIQSMIDKGDILNAEKE